MSKYDPLTRHLSRQAREFVPMTFAEIERLIDGQLPKSARSYRAWWSNNPSNSVMTAAWLKAGYKSQDVDIAGEKLVFHRSMQAGATNPSAEGTHPLVGALKGLVRTPENSDLTRPTGERWLAEQD